MSPIFKKIFMFIPDDKSTYGSRLLTEGPLPCITTLQLKIFPSFSKHPLSLITGTL